MSKRKTHFVLSIIAFLILLGLWSFFTYTRIVKSFFLPTPTEVLTAGYALFTKQKFLSDIGISLIRILAGFISATILAIPFGILIGINKKAEAFYEPVIDFIRYIPIPALIPLLILWFGIGETEKIVVIAISVFFQLVLMIANSVGQTPRQIINFAKTLDLKKIKIITQVILPHSWPRIFDDLRVSMGWAWSSLILAEIVGSVSGIGFVIIKAQRLLTTANAIAAIIIVGLLGLLTDYLFKYFHKTLFPWTDQKR